MHLRPDQLPANLDRRLLPVYLVAGDEPLQLDETVDRIRQHARQQGFDERQVFTVVDQRFDWNDVRSEMQSMGLFGGRRLLEIRLGSQRPDRNGSPILCQMLENPPDDVLLLLVSSALDRRRDLGSKWVSAIEQCGAVVNISPVDITRLPRWIEQRALDRRLQLDSDAVALLSELSEGNLLACAQEIDKLALLFPDTRVGAAQIEQSAGDCSRYTVFDLTDAIARSAERALKILDGLRAEGTDEIRILWALAREARIFEAFASGNGSSQRLPQHKAREAEQHALRLGLPAIGAALALAARVDQTIKGMRAGDPASGNTALTLRLAGQPLPPIFEQL